MNNMLFFALAYLIGSIPSGIIVAKLFKLTDPRKVGSGNIGATNMVRAGGKIPGLVTLLLDALKAVVTFFICNEFHYLDIAKLSLDGEYETVPMIINIHFAYLVGFATMIGHCFPVWLKFKGGKGVATGLGLIAVIHLCDQPHTAYWLLLFTAVWIGTYKLTKIVSVASLVTFAVLPLYTLIVFNIWVAPLLVALLIFIRHTENIKRLLHGEEHAFKQK